MSSLIHDKIEVETCFFSWEGGLDHTVVAGPRVGCIDKV